MSLYSQMLIHAIAEKARDEAMTEGIAAMVASYYEDYTDATELEDGFVVALLGLGKYLSDYPEEAIGDMIKSAEKAFSEARDRVVSTPDLPTEDYDDDE